jgi:hypothetical protein
METEHIKVYFKEIQGARDKAAANMLEIYVCPIMNAK